ncbi:unnamed protein product [Polarella glacialis]|uniref:Uncharacterized protein n=1 Tax=Polarella glacialis TaxID=89957 RepID=A0A813L1K5_POLGL|nr:unnamed protein product [Polarella glacialis]
MAALQRELQELKPSVDERMSELQHELQELQRAAASEGPQGPQGPQGLQGPPSKDDSSPPPAPVAVDRSLAPPAFAETTGTGFPAEALEQVHSTIQSTVAWICSK